MSPSYRIVFYVSGHGFGHASRAAAVIHALLRARPDAHVVVKTAAPAALFTGALGPRCEVVQLQCDAGMAQIDSLHIDTAETIRRARAFQQQFPALADAEAAYLRATGARVTVGDVPPLAVAAAHVAGVPSVAIGNFTWDWIYEGCRHERARALAEDIRRVYRDATLALRLPMWGGFAGLGGVIRDIPFIARESTRQRDEVRRALGLPPADRGRPLVLMAFGGHGIAGLNTRALGRLHDYVIATTDASAPNDSTSRDSGLLHISQQLMRDNALDFLDLVRAADVVVTKPGYSIISEAIANNTALLYTSRADFVEYDVLANEMPRYLRVELIAQDALLNGDWNAALRRLLSKPAPAERPALNGAEVAAEEILALVRKNE
jgi:L-arabinokinase